ncbi:hypothetical protein BJ166DRAFT_514547 [Pestalotiopsis sp. NC0098]|nr:hypothetical protein BJ166DRAFT_514547 [Pestalotiopsis sp. NC0098]
MATLSLPDLTVSTFTRGLETYAHILGRAQQYARDKGIDANSLVTARLIEDQLPLSFQVQNATKAVQLNLGRLSGTEPVLFENNEQTFEDLQQRISKALEAVKSFDVAKAADKGNEYLDFPWAGQTHKITVQAAILTQGLPNFYFHLTTGYSILRSQGVPLGKADYLGSFLAL